MKRKWVVAFLEMILFLVLVDCVSTSDRPTSQASLLAPSPSALTNTDAIASPSTSALTNADEMDRPSPRTHTPTLTSTTTSAFLPLPSEFIQPTPLFTPAFPATASGFYSFDDPTPIATPPAGSYQLKTWNEADGMALIRFLQQTAYETDIHFAGDFRGSFLAYQQVVRQAAREFLLRYPDSVDREQVDWQITFTNTLDRRDSDEWVVAEIARRINHGWLDPAYLKSGLEPLGFVAKPARLEQDFTSFAGESPGNLVMNLFGDNQPAYVWEIQNTEEAYYGQGMYVAVEQLPDGSFRVARIHSRHSFYFSGGLSIEADELTGDGQPELIVSDWRCESGGCMIGSISVYQWQQDHFAEISHGNFGSQTDPTQDGLIWELEVKDQDISSDIVVTNSSLFDPTFHRTLSWNGEWFQIKELSMEPEPRSLSNDFFRGWIGYAMEYTEFDGIQTVFDYMLKYPPEEMGVAFPDFIRFQMAMVDVFNSRVETAREQLQSIVDSPTDPAKPMVAEVAAAFLENYQTDEDTYRSCHAANLEVERSLMSYSPLSSRNITDEWGLRPPSSLCNPRTAFRLLLGQLDLRPGDDVTARLREADVPVLRSLKVDLDGDEFDDWLVVIDAPGSERGVEAWVFVNSGRDYIVVPVFNYRAGFFAKFFIYSTNNLIKLDTFPFPDERPPATVLQVGDVVYLFVVHHKGPDVDVQHLLDDNHIASFQIDPEASEIIFAYSPGTYGSYYDVYAWQEGLGRFLNLSQIDQLIFEQGDYDEAIRVIGEKLSKLDPERPDYESDAAHLYYMLGLAYELQGNSSAAVENYLKVWREFPGSPYALIAREKIE